MEETNTFRLSFHRGKDTVLACWNKLPEDVVEKIPLGYYYDCYCISVEDGEITKRTYVLLDPVKRLRKTESRFSIGSIEVGFDD